MTTYTLHVPDEVDPGEPEALDQAKLVPDAFVLPAFWFSALWFFWHRLWLAGLLVLAAEVLVWGAGLALGLHPAAGFAIALLLSWLIGLEASSLRRWTYARTGRPIRDAVTASDALNSRYGRRAPCWRRFRSRSFGTVIEIPRPSSRAACPCKVPPPSSACVRCSRASSSNCGSAACGSRRRSARTAKATSTARAASPTTTIAATRGRRLLLIRSTLHRFAA